MIEVGKTSPALTALMVLQIDVDTGMSEEGGEVVYRAGLFARRDQVQRRSAEMVPSVDFGWGTRPVLLVSCAAPRVVCRRARVRRRQVGCSTTATTTRTGVTALEDGAEPLEIPTCPAVEESGLSKARANHATGESARNTSVWCRPCVSVPPLIASFPESARLTSLRQPYLQSHQTRAS